MELINVGFHWTDTVNGRGAFDGTRRGRFAHLVPLVAVLLIGSSCVSQNVKETELGGDPSASSPTHTPDAAPPSTGDSRDGTPLKSGKSDVPREPPASVVSSADGSTREETRPAAVAEEAQQPTTVLPTGKDATAKEGAARDETASPPDAEEVAARSKHVEKSGTPRSESEPRRLSLSNSANGAKATVATSEEGSAAVTPAIAPSIADGGGTPIAAVESKAETSAEGAAGGPVTLPEEPGLNAEAVKSESGAVADWTIIGGIITASVMLVFLYLVSTRKGA